MRNTFTSLMLKGLRRGLGVSHMRWIGLCLLIPASVFGSSLPASAQLVIPREVPTPTPSQKPESEINPGSVFVEDIGDKSRVNAEDGQNVKPSSSAPRDAVSTEISANQQVFIGKENGTGSSRELSGWVRLVQRRIEGVFAVPANIRVEDKENIAEVSFWVGRDGQLLSPPVVTRHAPDTALGRAGVNAVHSAAPFPPLPDTYPHEEQLVVYSFVLRK